MQRKAMRYMSIFLWVFAGIFAALWAFAYVYIGSLACAFSGPEGSKACGIKMPWELQGGDQTMLFYVPVGLLAMFVIAAFLTGRAAKSKKGAV